MLDGKGRIILPAKFRTIFGKEGIGYLTQYLEGCLSLWTPEEFEAKMRSVQQEAALGPAQRNLARIWAAGSSEVRVDGQGRLAVPPHLRAFAGLEEERPVLVHGAIDRVELWQPARWQAKVARDELEAFHMQ